MPKQTAGQVLKDSRIKRHLTLDECSKRTHISPRLIDALEGDRWEDLPSESHRLGFLRLYARFLGVSADEVVALYQHRGESVPEVPENVVLPEPESEPAPAPKSTRSVKTKSPMVSADPAPSAPATPQPPAKKLSRSMPLPWPVIGSITAAVFAAVWVIYHAHFRGVEPTRPATWHEFRPKDARLSSTPTASSSHHLKILAVSDVWCYLSENNLVLYSGILRAGQSKEWRPSSPVQLRIGNIEALQVFWNDQPADLLTGSHGKVNTVTLPAPTAPKP